MALPAIVVVGGAALLGWTLSSLLKKRKKTTEPDVVDDDDDDTDEPDLPPPDPYHPDHVTPPDVQRKFENLEATCNMAKSTKSLLVVQGSANVVGAFLDEYGGDLSATQRAWCANCLAAINARGNKIVDHLNATAAEVQASSDPDRIRDLATEVQAWGIEGQNMARAARAKADALEA